MATLMKLKDANEPSLMSIGYDVDDVIYAAINVNICKLTDGTYEWDSLVLPEFALNNIHKADAETKRAVLIAHIIKAYYNDNQMTAIINNYLLDPEDVEHKQEFFEMQKVRKMAKDTARQIIKSKMF